MDGDSDDEAITTELTPNERRRVVLKEDAAAASRSRHGSSP